MIGLALSGGGVKGSYEIGAYYAFRKCHIKFDGVCGTSIGSFNGAMIASGMHKKLLKFWLNADVGKVLGFDQKLVDKINKNEKDKEFYKYTFDTLIKVLKNKGVSTSGLSNKLNYFNIEKKLRKSKMDYGLATFRMKDLKEIEIFKEEIPDGKLNDYIVASCYFPIFKEEKIMDDSYFFDGGIRNNLPINMLLNKGYDKVYAVDLRAVGYNQKVNDKYKVIYIKPSHKLSSLFSVKTKDIRNNVYMGYYDALKVLKNYDGDKYIFKNIKNEDILKYLKNVRKFDLEKAKIYFGVKSNKKLLIKLCEYYMNKDNLTYFHVYSMKKILRKYHNEKSNKILSSVMNNIYCKLF